MSSKKRSATAAEQSVKDLSRTGPTDKPPPRPTKPKRKASVPGSVNDSRRCTATAHRTGERCGAPAIKGGNVCRVHGGAAPQVRRSAQQRLLDLVEPAINELAKLLNRSGVEDGVKLRAIQMLLDRTGHGPGQTVTVQTSAWEDMLKGIADHSDNVQLDRSLEDIVDAEVVGEDNG